jgi:hypothetical protein
MRRVSMATRDEVVAAVVERYALSSRLERGRILDEFVALTGHHRKHAMRLLRSSGPAAAERRVRRDRVYDAAMREAVIVLWEASDRVQNSAANRQCERNATNRTVSSRR